PERVVTVGYVDQDAVLALGFEPVGVREWFGEYPYATWPWAQDELGDATPEVLGEAELNFEQITTLEPDLITAVFSGITEDEYETLSEIAPTIAQSGEYIDYGAPWQEMTRTIGRALGREERAGKLVAEVEGRFEAAREAHPEFEGASGVVAGPLGSDGNPHAYGPEDVRGQFLTALGFEIPAEIADLAGEESFASFSRERLDLLDTDVLVWLMPEEREGLTEGPLYQNLAVANEGRDIFLGVSGPVSGALNFSTVLSLPFALENVVPRLAAAIDGDPETEVESAS
ncbi:MAG: iron-siderophore ABC transporter substrate-binding protein, partial [Rubrobacteraceae bacterium]